MSELISASELVRTRNFWIWKMLWIHVRMVNDAITIECLKETRRFGTGDAINLKIISSSYTLPLSAIDKQRRRKHIWKTSTTSQANCHYDITKIHRRTTRTTRTKKKKKRIFFRLALYCWSIWICDKDLWCIWASSKSLDFPSYFIAQQRKRCFFHISATQWILLDVTLVFLVLL